MLQKERAAKTRRGLSHPFGGFPLDRLGTHSLKRSAVSLMKDTCTSTALCGAIAGTTAKTLDRVYDTPTLKRQQALVARAFGPRGHHVAGRPAPGGQEGEECGGGGDGGDGGGGSAPAAAGRPAGKVLRGIRQMPGGAVVGMLPVVRTHVLRPDGWKSERQF